jgi:hypothetical protein
MMLIGATWTQPKTTKEEQHGPTQKLQWMSNTDPNKKLQSMSIMYPTKKYKR